MNTVTDTRGSLLRRHPEIIGGPLVAVLFAVAYWGMESVAAMIPYTLVMAVAVFTALTSVSVVARSVAWIVLVTAWISDFFSYFDHSKGNTDAGWVVPVAETLIWVWLAMPAAVFLLVCWKSPRPRFDTYLAEAILLVLIAMQLGASTPGYISEAAPGEVPVGILLYLGAAAYFGVAAWLVPTRRIFYGVTALGGIAIAASGTVLFSGEWVHNFVLFPIMALGIPLVGLVLQIARRGRGKVRATAAA
ncbi:hypothetical protein [Glycomyces tarimensis]